MIFTLYSLLFIFILTFIGLGFSAILLPKNLKNYLWYFAPFIGYCYITLAGWYLYRFDLRGTDSYSIYILILPLVFLIVGFKQIKFFWKTDKSILFSILIAVTSLLILSIPLWKLPLGLTSISLLNCDLPDSASISTFLKEFNRTSTIGFLGQSNAFISQADNSIFGGPFAAAFISSLLNLQPYQIQTMSVMVFFVLSGFGVYILAKNIFGYDEIPARLIQITYAIGPVYYIVYQGYQGQVIAMGLMLGIFILHLFAFRKCESLGEYARYLPLSILLNWGIIITYSHMWLFIYGLLFAAVLMEGFHSRKWLNITSWIIFATLTIIATFALSPYRGRVAWLALIEKGAAATNWGAYPIFSPWLIQRLTLNHPMLSRLSLAMFIAIIAMFVFILFLGWAKALREDKKIIYLALLNLALIVLGYIGLGYLGRTEDGWGGYKSFKLITFFLPLVMLDFFVFVQHMNFRTRDIINQILNGIAVLLFIISLGIGFDLVGKTSGEKHLSVSSQMAELMNIENLPQVESINILGKDWWEILWETDFLMKKKLYFETTTYVGRTASNLDGEWDLMKYTSNAIVERNSRDIISINSLYFLSKSKRAINIK
jgi:hypothetical protein